MKSKLIEAAHETVKGLYKAGLVKTKTMREFDELCLPKVNKLSPSKIKKIRLQQKISQAVFAKYLNTSLSTVRQWEQGEKHPHGASLKLLNLVEQKGIDILI